MGNNLLIQHLNERKEFQSQYNKALNQLLKDQDLVLKQYEYSRSSVPREWREKLDRDMRKWLSEWGMHGWRTIEMESRHNLEEKLNQLSFKHFYLIPDFLQQYYDDTNIHGQHAILELANQFFTELEKYLTDTVANRRVLHEGLVKLMDNSLDDGLDELMGALESKYITEAQIINCAYSQLNK